MNSEAEDSSKGIASLLLKHLAHIARAKGVAPFVADVLSRTKSIMTDFSRRGLPVNKQSVGGIFHVTLSLREDVV